MKLNIIKTPHEAIKELADFFVSIANENIASKGSFSVALSGGNSPKNLHQLLASDDYKSKIDWSKVHFFFGDERYVAHDHPDSNYLMAYETLLKPLHIHESQINKVNTDLDPATAAQEYERCISKHFENEPQFDLILLGLGDDAHTASIFPNTNLIWIDEEMVKEVYLEDKQVYRISFTAPLINKAQHVVFLTFGTNKAEAVKAVISGEKDVNKYPAQLINPKSGRIHWYMDDAAATLIKN